MIGDAKATYRTAIRKSEAVHLASASKVEVIQVTRIWKAEAANAMQASKLQQQHQEAMWNLEEEALEVKKCTHQSFLWACGVALKACPNEALAKLMYPLHLLMGSPSLPGPLMVTSPLTRSKNPVTSPHCPSRPVAVVPSPRAKQHQSPEQEAEADHPGEPAQQRQREGDPLVGHLGDSCHEAFCKDSELVQCIRQTYFRTHVLTFHKEDTYKLMEVFKELVEMAGLLDTKVYPVQDWWVGKRELCSAYSAVRGSAKDLHFFRIVVPLESPKIMGLQGIHSPEVLKWQAGLSFCLWCRKEGAKWGDHCKLPVHQGLLPWAGVWDVYPTSLPHQTRCDATPRDVCVHPPAKATWIGKWRSIPEPPGLTHLGLLGWLIGSYWADLSGVTPHSTSDLSYWSLNPGCTPL